MQTMLLINNLEALLLGVNGLIFIFNGTNQIIVLKIIYVQGLCKLLLKCRPNFDIYATTYISVFNSRFQKLIVFSVCSIFRLGYIRV